MANTTYQCNVSVRMPKTMRDALRRHADTAGISVTAYIRDALETAMTKVQRRDMRLQDYVASRTVPEDAAIEKLANQLAVPITLIHKYLDQGYRVYGNRLFAPVADLDNDLLPTARGFAVSARQTAVASFTLTLSAIEELTRVAQAKQINRSALVRDALYRTFNIY